MHARFTHAGLTCGTGALFDSSRKQTRIVVNLLGVDVDLNVNVNVDADVDVD